MAALLLCLALMNGAQAAVRKGSMVRITLQNGTTVLGEVVSETSLGLLISNGSKTELVPFANVKTVDDLTPASAEPPPPPPPPPPPLTADEPLPAPKRAANISEERKLRFGVGVNGGAADGYYGVGWLVGAEFVVSFNFTEWFNLRVLANYTHTQNGPYSTNLGLAIAMPIIWFGVYGLGVAVAVGAGNVTYGRLGAAVGAFASTGIDSLLRGMGVDHLAITGISTNMCVESTAREAADRGYRVTLVEDACATTHRDLHDATMRNFSRLFGRVRITADVLAEVKTG